MPLFVVVMTILSYTIFFIWGYVDSRHLGSSFCSSALIGSATLILTILISLMVGAFANSNNFNAKTTVTSSERYELRPLQSVEGVSTNYLYISINHGNNKTQYTFLYDEEGKGIASMTIPSENTYLNTIKENETPHVKKLDVQYENPILNFFCGDLFGPKTEYTIVIPENSLTDNSKFKINQ